MRLVHELKTCAMAMALAGAAGFAGPALAQSGDASVTAPATPALVPNVLAAQGGIGGVQDRVRSRSTNAPNREDKTLIGLDSEDGKGHFNAIFGGIRQGAGLAGGLNITTGDSIGNVELYGDALVSIRGYYQGEAGVIFGRDSKLKGDARFRYTRRTRDNFFGVGPFSSRDTVVENFIVNGQAYNFVYGGETNFETETRSLAGGVYYNFTPKVQAGVYVEHRSTSVYEGADDADPPLLTRFWPYTDACDEDANGVLPRSLVPGLNGSRFLSVGGYVEADLRDNDDGLTKGGYLYARVASHTDTADDDLVDQQFAWTQFTFDARGYLPLGSDRLSLALRFFTDLNSPRDGKEIPFTALAQLGGNADLRGFDTFRFHGENSILFQGEARATFYRPKDKQGEAKAEQGADVIFFGDLGQIWGNGYDSPCAPDVTGFDPNAGSDFDSDNYEADFGVGLSYRLSKGFALRVDLAHSNERSSVVRLTFSRGF